MSFGGDGGSLGDVELGVPPPVGNLTKSEEEQEPDFETSSEQDEDEDEGDGNLSEEWDAWEGLKGRPERWAPLGANEDEEKTSSSEEKSLDPVEVKKMKDDQEQLTSALLALTTHFAQVQFRVQQIVVAPEEEKQVLLKDLEEFTFRGIPSAVTDHWGGGPGEGNQAKEYSPQDDIKEKMRVQREKQKDLISQLKTQLEELESYAYQTGDAGLPQSVLLERHKIVVEQLKTRLNLNVDELEKLSDSDLRLQVDQAITDIVSPLKMKEQLVDQLKTQISDLERFIQYLHGEQSYLDAKKGFKNNKKRNSTSKCDCSSPHAPSGGDADEDNSFTQSDLGREEELRAKTIQMMRKALTLIQMFAVAQFGCSTNHFHMNQLKKSAKGNHYGDLRAGLEIAINRVYELAAQSQSNAPADSDYTSDCEDAPSILCNQALTSAVRKDLAAALANLLEHGLMHMGHSQSLVPFVGCFSSRSAAGSGFLSAWDLILKYYEIKNGERYNATPARRLSQSFGLEIVGSVAITNKQLLLSTIDNIISSHTRYKRSPESHFKAFVCAALNSRKLVVWLRLIVRCQGLIEQYYQPWGYTAHTGFEDALRSLDKLTRLNFDLPVDLAIRQFQNIKDAFQ